MSNKVKYGSVIVISVIVGFVAAWTVQKSTYNFCYYGNSVEGCLMQATGIDKEKTFSDQVQRGLIFGTATSVFLFGAIKMFEKK